MTEGEVEGDLDAVMGNVGELYAKLAKVGNH